MTSKQYSGIALHEDIILRRSWFAKWQRPILPFLTHDIKQGIPLWSITNTNRSKLPQIHAAISDSPLLMYRLLANTTGKPNCIHMHEQHMKHKYKCKSLLSHAHNLILCNCVYEWELIQCHKKLGNAYHLWQCYIKHVWLQWRIGTK